MQKLFNRYIFTLCLLLETRLKIFIMSEKLSEYKFSSGNPGIETEEIKKDDSGVNKAEKYKELLGGAEAIFVLDADIREVRGDNGQKNYRSTSHTSNDTHGYLAWGRERVLAAAEIGQFFPETKIVTTSRYQPDMPAHAEIYAGELETLGIPKTQIEKEEKSISTLTELIEMVKMAKRNKWNSLAIITSEYHIPRTEEMYRQLNNLARKSNLADEEFIDAREFFEQEGGLKLSFISAEEVLPYRGQGYKKFIEKIKGSGIYKERVAAEQEGLRQLQGGTYGAKKSIN